MEFTVNIEKGKANMFLRALWSQIRTNLGKGGWNYSPYKNGLNKVIHIGWLSAETLKEPLQISLKYKEKGSITTISFESSELEKSHTIKQKVQDCVQNAMNYNALLQNAKSSYRIKALELPISSYYGSNFNIHPTKKDSLNIIELNILGFDKVDIRSEAQGTLNRVLNILSVETQSVYYYANSNDHGEEYRVEEVDTDDILWYGTSRPSLNGHFTISNKARVLIEKVIMGEYDEFNNFLKACRLFHSAHKYNMLRYKSEELELSERFRRLDLPNEEVAAVLYMSALEVASITNNYKPQKCKECGNAIYSISSRVLEYIQHFEADDYTVKNFYKDRSIYLHAGGFFSDQSYTGTTIPQIDPDSASGCNSQVPMRNLLSVSDVVSFCLRQQLQEML